MASQHISDHDLERYYLGMVTADEELAPLEEHLLWCHPCIERAQEAENYVDLVRASLIEGNYDLTTDVFTRKRKREWFSLVLQPVQFGLGLCSFHPVRRNGRYAVKTR